MEENQNFESVEAAVSRLTLMAGNLEEKLAAMEQRAAGNNSGLLDHMTATVETAASQQFESLELRLAEAERQIADLKANAAVLQANAAALQANSQGTAQPGRRTVGASTAQLLAKHGVSEIELADPAILDAALISLPIEQRIAVKSQLLRSGLLG